MLKRKQFLFFMTFWAVLMSSSIPHVYAQEDTGVQRVVIRTADDYSDDPETVDPDEDYDYEDEESGPFYRGFSFNDSLKNDGFSKRTISDADWKTLSNKPEFQYEKEIQKKPAAEKENSPNKFMEWLTAVLASFFGFLMSDVGKVVLWIIVAAALCGIIFLIFKRRGIYLFARSGKKIKKATSADETSDDFVPESWENVIEQAERSGNYRLAVRHSFRHLLHIMEAEKIISLEKSLSNHQILGILRRNHYYDEFRQLLRHYEYIWYGAFEVDEKAYGHIKSIYIKLRGQL